MVEIFSNDEAKEYPEGKLAFKMHRKRERNPKVIKDAKALFIKKHGRLFCEACGFDFYKFYGDKGKDFIEGHHLKPVKEMSEGETTKVEDIAILCINCHRIMHRNPLISVEELADLVRNQKEAFDSDNI
jgi:5-methylcytosine-specific restriction enzyme A